MNALQSSKVMFFSKVKLIYSVTHVELMSYALHFSLHVVVEISVARNMKISRNLFDSEGTNQSAPIIISESLPNCFQLSDRIGFMKQLITSEI